MVWFIQRNMKEILDIEGPMIQRKTVLSLSIVMLILLSACSAVTGASLFQTTQPAATLPASPTATVVAPAAQVPITASDGAVVALEGTLQQIYQQVNPSVVNIQVTM